MLTEPGSQLLVDWRLAGSNLNLLIRDGKDWHFERLIDRKQELRRLLANISPPFPLRYVDYH